MIISPLFDEEDKQTIGAKLERIQFARQELLRKYPYHSAEILYRLQQLEQRVIRKEVRRKRKESIYSALGLVAAGILLGAIAAAFDCKWHILYVFSVGLFFSGLFTAGINAAIMYSEAQKSKGDTSDTK